MAIIETLVTGVINGTTNGIGTAIGVYLVGEHLINRFQLRKENKNANGN